MSIKVQAYALGTALENLTTTTVTIDASRAALGPGGAEFLSKHVIEFGENCKWECSLTSLDLRENDLGDEGAYHIAKLLIHPGNNIKELILAGNKLTSGFWRGNNLDIAAALTDENNRVEKLWMFNNGLRNMGCTKLAASLKHENNKVQNLHLGDNSIGDEGAKEMIEVCLNQHCKLTVLNLAMNSDIKEGFSLGKALGDPNCRLTHLCLNMTGISGFDLTKVYRGMAGLKASNPPDPFRAPVDTPLIELEGIDISYAHGVPEEVVGKGNQVLFDHLRALNKTYQPAGETKDEGGITEEQKSPDFVGKTHATNDIFNALQVLEDPSITHLDLWGARPGLQQIEIMATKLTSNLCNIRHLDMNGNKVGNEAVCKLAKVLSSTRITTLNISCNDINLFALVDVCHAIGNDPETKLEKLLIFGNQFGNEGCKKLAEALTSPSNKLKELSVSGCNISDDGAQVMWDSLTHEHCKLTHLTIANNAGIKEGFSLGKALGDPNCHLTHLCLNNTGISGFDLTKVYQGMAGLKASNPPDPFRAPVDTPLIELEGIDISYAHGVPEEVAGKGNQVLFDHLRALNKTYQPSEELQASAALMTEEQKSKDFAGQKVDASSLFEVLEALDNFDVTEIKVYNQDIGVGGAETISKKLAASNVRLLSLNSCNIAEDGANHLATALVNPDNRVETLTLASNKIRMYIAHLIGAYDRATGKFMARREEDYVLDLADALSSEHCKVKTLLLFGNEFSNWGSKKIAAVLRSENNSIETLNVGTSNIGDEGAVALFEALLDDNCKVTDFCALGNSIEEGSNLQKLLSSPKCRLEKLNLAYNKIGGFNATQAFRGLCTPRSGGVATLVECDGLGLGRAYGNIGAWGLSDQEVVDYLRTSQAAMWAGLISLDRASPKVYRSCSARLLIVAYLSWSSDMGVGKWVRFRLAEAIKR